MVARRKKLLKGLGKVDELGAPTEINFATVGVRGKGHQGGRRDRRSGRRPENEVH